MAILNKDDFMKKIKERIGEDTSDEALAFMEDITDTFNDLESKSKGDGTDWKTKYEENDKMWREKYKSRFFDGTDKDTPPEDDNTPPDGKSEDEQRAEEITINDLFTDKGDK